jgi:hypothetical protein
MSTPAPSPVKPVTTQKVRAALRKAQLHASKYNRSRMIRGWGEWTSGYRVTAEVGDPPTVIVVRYRHHDPECAARQLARCHEALLSLGAKMHEDCVVIPVSAA